jgi:hypothetical protein
MTPTDFPPSDLKHKKAEKEEDWPITERSYDFCLEEIS